MNNKVLGINNLQKNPSPMAVSPYPYYQDLDKALSGLELALERHSGHLEEVKNTDILAFSNIDPDVLMNVFTDANGLIKVIYKEMGELFIKVERLIEKETNDEIIVFKMFELLREKSPMLRVIFLLNDYSVWKRSLRKIISRIAERWPKYGSSQWNYLYENFCPQFQTVLEKWSESGFSREKINDCIQMLFAWIEADRVFYIEVSELLVSWNNSR